MRNFPQYNLKHFTSLRYYDGGLSTSQVTAMFDHIVEEKNEEIRFQAALRGVKLKGDKAQPATQKDGEIIPMFGDPDSYDHLSQEERNKMTNDMMGKHKNWVATKGGGV